MKEIIKNYLSYIPYVIFVFITLLYAKIITSLYCSIETTKDGGFVKLFEANSPVWYYKSANTLILYDKILICVFILMYFLSTIFIRKKYIVSLFILLLPLILMFCDWLYLRYTIAYRL